MKVGLTVKERLSLGSMLPIKGDILQQTLVKEISKSIEVTKEEREKVGITITPSGFRWEEDCKKKVEEEVIEYDFSEVEIRFLQKQIARLDDEKNVTQQILDLCLKIQDIKVAKIEEKKK